MITAGPKAATSRQLGGALIAQRATFVHGLQFSLLIAVLLLLATAAASMALKSR